MDGAFVPPWIKPANEVEHFLTGFQIGQRRALADAEVAERQMSMQMKAQDRKAHNLT